MNSEAQIAKFRAEVLPKYVEMANKIKNWKTVTKVFEVHYIDKSELKQCSQCGEWLPFSEYHSENRSYCRKCEKIRSILNKKKTS